MAQEYPNKKEKTVPVPTKVKPLPPVGIDREKLIPHLTAAYSAVGELRGFLGTLKNPDLLIAPFRKREAVASSAIEGTRATLDEVMEFEAKNDKPTDEEDRKFLDIIEVMKYEDAMSIAVRELETRPIGEVILKKTHSELLRSARGSNKDRGNFRKLPVRVGDYIPPVCADIPALISNWEKYLNSDIEQDALIRIGVAHYQFEAIHPFMDGNGRMGRLIIPLFLSQVGILNTPVLYVSHYLEQYKVEYQRLLHRIDTDGEWTEWLIFFLKALEEQAKITTSMAKSIQSLYERLIKDVVGEIRSKHSMAVLDLIFIRPVFTSSYIDEKLSAKSRATTYNLLNKFVEAGVLKEITGLGREKFYSFTELRSIIRA